jgi:flagellar biosynthetic protein FliR
MSFEQIDFNAFWAWFLIFTRMAGMFSTLPGIGTEQVPAIVRMSASLIISMTIAATGIHAESPGTGAEGLMMIGGEYLFGYILGTIPNLVIIGVSVAGQVTSGAIGLAQASMVDPSLGGQTTVLAHINSMLATIIFLAVDGHHAVIRAASGDLGGIGAGVFRPNEGTAAMLLDRFEALFTLALVMSAPILVTVLVTQFVFGLITKFVPKVNVFIVSFPLLVLLGIFLSDVTIPSMTKHVIFEFDNMTEYLGGFLS